jgi:acyl transferase domain-containing protein/acyl carrier protein
MSTYNGFEIAVIGMACRFPQAPNIHAFWENLKNGRDCVTDLTREELISAGVPERLLNRSSYIRSNVYLEDKNNFDSEFFDYLPDEARLMSPQIRVFHECCWEALEDSGYGKVDPKNEIGLFAAGSPNVEWEMYSLFRNREGLLNEITAAHLRDITFLCTLISYKLNLKGPSVFLQTACSSSLVTIHEACNSLLWGECSMALAGGVTIRNFSKRGYIYTENSILSKDGRCRPFDADASGTIGGEGAGVVVLKRLKDALRDRDNIYAIVKGTRINNDGHHKAGFTAPSPKGQADVIGKALKMAGVSPDTIGYIETHGTATLLGDPIEIQALYEVFGQHYRRPDQKCAIGSVKSNMGHLDTAAGVAGFIKTVLSIKNRQIPPSLHFVRINPEIDFDNSPFYVNTALKSWEGKPIRAGVSSFGIGGTNVHAILEEAPSTDVPSADGRQYQLIALSARNEESLERYAGRILDHLKNHRDINLADTAYTLLTGRARFTHRKMLVCDSVEQAISMLGAGDPLEKQVGDKQESLKNIVFMFPGQGSQYGNMCRDLYLQEPEFKKIVDECLDMARLFSELDLRAALFPPAAGPGVGDLINDTRYTQPLLFIIEYSMACLLMGWGIKPSYMIGHSIGEYVAACISGVFSLSDAIRLVIRRGALMSKAPHGSMLSISIDEKELGSFLAENPYVELAVMNGDQTMVVSGDPEHIDTFERQITRAGYHAKKLRTSHAFHCYLMDGVLESFEHECSSVRFGDPRIPYVSNITGELVDPADVKQPAYWSRQLRNAVRFSQGYKTLLKKGDGIFIEVGPGRTLCDHVDVEDVGGKRTFVINTIRHPKQHVNDQWLLLRRLGQLWLKGVTIDWNSYYAAEKRRKVSAPTYSFDKIPFPTDVDAIELISDYFSGSPEENADPDKWIHVMGWQRTIAPNPGYGSASGTFTFLVFAGADEFSDRMARMLTSAGEKVIMVKNGREFIQRDKGLLEIDMEEPGDFMRLWDHLKEEGIKVRHILYCTGLDGRSTAAGYNDIEPALVSGYLGLSFLGKSIALMAQSDPISITVIDNHLASITDDDLIDPLKSTIHGPAKVMPLEMPGVRCKVVDIPCLFHNEAQLKSCLAQVISEIFYDCDDPFVSYRFNERWAPSFQDLSMDAQTGSNRKIMRNGVYVITGGFGGMGFAIARDLVMQKEANVVIVHRSAFPDKDQWDRWLLEKGPEDAVSRKIGQLLDMERTGRQVSLYRADISSEDQVKDLALYLKKTYRQINGLIWAAGEIDFEGILLNRDKEKLVRCITSKVHGVLLFEKYIGFEGLDFIAFFSSMGNVFYRAKFGQAGYNAANEFLQNFAVYARKKYGSHVFTINWCDWLDVGMTFRNANKEIKNADQVNASIANGIYPEEGVAIFHKCLQSKADVFAIYRGDIGRALKLHKEAYEYHREEQLNRQEEDVPFGQQKGSYEQRLVSILSRYLGRSDIKGGDEFIDLGIDSLKGMTLVARVNKEMSVQLSIKDIYEYPTVIALAGYIENLEERSGSLHLAMDVIASTIRIDNGGGSQFEII